MVRTISKSQFKPKMLEYFRLIEKEQEELIITDHGKAVLKIVPIKASHDEEILQKLRGSVEKYLDPLEPVDAEWEVEQ